MNQNELLKPSKIIFSKRKSISLVVDTKGDFFVRAPQVCSEARIWSFIEKKADWIIKKRIEAKASIKYQPLKCKNGEVLPIFGEEYQISLTNSTRVRIDGKNILLPEQDSLNKLVLFLRRMLKKYLSVRVLEIARVMNLEYQSISISSARTNWGSCSGKNNLHFTFRLAMCPKYVIDYIIVHELSHVLVKNHSKEFWGVVAQFYPNYKQVERWLKDNRYITDIIT